MEDINYKKIKAWPFIEALKIKSRLSYWSIYYNDTHHYLISVFLLTTKAPP